MADRYWWRGAERTRSFHEWHLLYHLHRVGLPVPMPVAAGYQRRGRTYTASPSQTLSSSPSNTVSPSVKGQKRP